MADGITRRGLFRRLGGAAAGGAALTVLGKKVEAKPVAPKREPVEILTDVSASPYPYAIMVTATVGTYRPVNFIEPGGRS